MGTRTIIAARLLKLFIVSSLSLFVAFLATPALCQEEVQNLELASSPLLEQEAGLTQILATLNSLKQQLSTRERDLRSAPSPQRKEEITTDVTTLLKQVQDLERSFVEIATGVDLSQLEDQPSSKPIAWSTEIGVLVQPLLNELKSITSRPRELDRLRSESQRLEQRIQLVNEGRKNLGNLVEEVQDKRLKEALEKLDADWETREQQLSTDLTIATQKLSQKARERRNLSESAQELLQLFFKSRGRHLFLALLVTFLVWLGLKRLQPFIASLSRLHKYEASFAVKLFNFLYLVLTGIGTVLVFLLVLYLFGDWVLLVVALMILVGVLWASKQAIPRFWSQAVLLLNMGPVREHEVLVVEGIPWKVKALNFYTELENPCFPGEGLRFPLKDLIELRSRPYSDNELWFPSKVGDWVRLHDTTFGEVVSQTPELIRVKQLGGALKTFSISQYLDNQPVNLSQGFRVHVSFGVDYGLQSISTEEIPSNFKRSLEEALSKFDSNSSQPTVLAEFESAGCSALNIALMVDCQGKLAPHAERLKRLVQRVCVDTCTEQGWTIPFEQLTLHVANCDKIRS